jgi:hypothetical protein
MESDCPPHRQWGTTLQQVLGAPVTLVKAAQQVARLRTEVERTTQQPGACQP